MKVSLRFALFAASATAVAGAAALSSTACSSSSSGGGPSEDGGIPDTGTDSAPVSEDAGIDSSSPVDAGVDAPPTVTGMAIVTATGASLRAYAGDAVRLRVVLTMSDGTTQPLPAGMTVTWTTPETIVAQNPDDAGASVIPDAGTAPTGFYVQNPYRPERTDYPGTLFVINTGTAPDGGITVTAVLPDGGSLVAVVTVAPTPPGDPDAGSGTFISRLDCGDCHGYTGAGSPIAGYDDAGPFYILQGDQVPYPAPGLNNSTPDGGDGPNLAADPAWSAALLSMAAQGDIDNNGVALRKPMPDWLGRLNNVDGGVLGAQDFANIYAYLRTQLDASTQ